MLIMDVVASNDMSNVISALIGENGLSAASFFGVVKDLMPLVAMLVPVSLGVYFLRKLINGAGKAKVRF